jgi:hypothetical protein
MYNHEIQTVENFLGSESADAAGHASAGSARASVCGGAGGFHPVGACGPAVGAGGPAVGAGGPAVGARVGGSAVGARAGGSAVGARAGGPAVGARAGGPAVGARANAADVHAAIKRVNNIAGEIVAETFYKSMDDPRVTKTAVATLVQRTSNNPFDVLIPSNPSDQSNPSNPLNPNL